MLRMSLLAFLILTTTSLSARESPSLKGSWLISYSPTAAAVEVHTLIVSIEEAAGKLTGKVIAVPGKNATLPEVKSIEIQGKQIAVNLSNGVAFSGMLGSDKELILGSYGSSGFQYRAKLTRTEKNSIESITTPGKQLPEVIEAQKFTFRTAQLKNQARQLKDAVKKKEVLAEADTAEKEADEKVPVLYREAIAKHTNDPATIDVSLNLLRSAKKWKVDASEAKKLVSLIEKEAAPYGPKYSSFVILEAVDLLLASKGLEEVALPLIESRATALSDKEPLETQTRILSLYKSALEGTGKLKEVKAVELQLAKIEDKLDAEYLATVPPFKPEAFAGRKDNSATQVAVMELFTGAQCPPCVAADVAFDALGKSYKPSELILIQYHMHIPGPDPLTNPTSIGRWDYYREKFPKAVGGTPTSIFNGKPLAGGGGGMANSESKFNQYRKIIDPLLEKTTPVKLSGAAKMIGDKVEVAVEVEGAPTDGDFKLRVLLVEESLKYVGGNKLRFHHQVVRDMPGGMNGSEIKASSFKKTVTSDLKEVRAGLVKYLDEYAANERPFPYKARPLDLKHLRAIALVQDDKTGEILQAAMMEVEGK